ncbi:hypothetical protein H634G_06922 [Metarhizium anisopliae BRIP 53293]|uniref:Uncharacterized protein n=2 Tax=Metarhizium TaxID=5529 RepID=A0A0D9NZE8_METAN|nr:hypothetical protein H634G_06922 [Metarhizium anisopliae BRIP 53293]KJK93232.1 hypothetical protein H633G_02909 [Metarhizium anisopliae BRIP 53284]
MSMTSHRNGGRATLDVGLTAPSPELHTSYFLCPNLPRIVVGHQDNALASHFCRQFYSITVKMVFILGVNFNDGKLVKKALESFYALGSTTSSRIMAKYSIHKLAKVGSLSPRTVTSLTAELSQMTIETDARRIVQDNIRRLKDIGSYRGRRHAMGLPVRGQRTRTQTATANKLNRVDRRS